MLMSCVCSQVSAQAISKADSAYNNGDYALAIDEYTRLAKTNGVSSELYYNLGNAYSKGGFYGRAVVCYVRALSIDPSNTAARENLIYVESKVTDNNKAELKDKKLSVEPDNPSFFTSIKLFIVRDHLSDTWAVWSVVSFLIFIICVAIYLFSKNVMMRKIGFFAGFASVGISVITLIFSFMASSYKTNEGVVTSPKIHLYAEPSMTASFNKSALTRGTRTAILDSIANEDKKTEWYKVRLNSDFVGWVSADDFEPIDI